MPFDFFTVADLAFLAIGDHSASTVSTFFDSSNSSSIDPEHRQMFRTFALSDHFFPTLKVDSDILELLG